MRHHCLSVTLALLFCTLLPISSQASEWSEYASASIVRDIAEEGRYLWLATETGLVRFDKQEFTATQYTLYNSGLPTIYLTSIAIDRNGVKWIGCRQGLIRYDGTDWDVFSPSNAPITSPDIRDLVVDQNNALWIATSNEVARFSNGLWEVHTFPCLTDVTALYPAPDGSMWIGCNYAWESCHSAYVLRDGELLPVSDDFADLSVQAITGRNNAVWFAANRNEKFGNQTKTAGTIVSYDGVETRLYSWETAGFTEPTPIASASLDSAGSIWVTGQYGIYGMAGYDGTSWTFFTPDNSPLDGNRIYMIMTDSDGTLWLATSQGLLSYDGARWREFPSLGLPFAHLHQIHTFAVTTDHHIWAGYTNNIASLSDSCLYVTPQGVEVHPIPVNNTFLKSFPQVVMGHDNSPWISTWSSAVYRYADDTWELMLDSVEPIVRKLYMNSRGEMWTSRLEMFDGTEWTVFPEHDSTWFGGCSAITEDRNGTMWFGTTKGLISYDGTAWTSYPRSYKDMPDVGLGTLVMACDSANNIWLGSAASAGTPARGLYRFRDGEWYPHVGPFDSTAAIGSIATDRSGNLWVASGRLLRYDGSEWVEFNSSNSPMSFRPGNLTVDPDNTVWMTAATGILAYHQEMPVSVQETDRTTMDLVLEQNRPNPTVTGTSILYTLPATMEQQQVQLTVWNTRGVQVATLVDAIQLPGTYTVSLDTRELTPGVYYYRLRTGDTTVSRQMVVVR